MENPYLGGPRAAQHPRSSSSGEGKVSRRRRSTRSKPGGSNGGAPWLWGLPERQPGGGSSSSSNAALQQRMGGSRVLIPSRGGEAARPQESSERSARALTTCRRTWRVRPLAGGGCSGPNARARHQTRAGSWIWFVSPPPFTHTRAVHAWPDGRPLYLASLPARRSLFQGQEQARGTCMGTLGLSAGGRAGVGLYPTAGP